MAANWTTPQDWDEWVSWLQAGLHARSRWRLPLVAIGMLFAKGRRTVTTWLRAAGISDDFSDYYYFIGSLGRKTEIVATYLLIGLLRFLPLGPRVLLAVDDSPTKRYGPQVQGAGIHHNPTPGPADQRFLYGHIWVTLSLVVRHAWWGTIGLPLLACLYVRRKDVSKLPSKYGWKFLTKLELAVRLVLWMVPWLVGAGKQVWVVVDGGYARRPLLRPLRAQGVIVVGRLRKDAGLRDVPPARTGRRGRPRKYGANKLSLAKRAGQRRGWQQVSCRVYGEDVVKTFKTFLATYEKADGLIRVVIVKEDDGWMPYFSTDTNASVVEILEAVADRAAIEQDFHDLKEVWGAGQQQVRNLWANLGVFHLNLWLHTLVELWAWKRPKNQLTDRRASPWDDPQRRPSHQDRLRALRRSCLREEITALHQTEQLPRKIQTLLRRLENLAA
jgi:DDE superfamily endonuclease